MSPIKWIAAAMILGASSWTGLRAALFLRRSDRQLAELISALDVMESEVRFTRASFPAICRTLSGRCIAENKRFFLAVADVCESGRTPGPGMTERILRETGPALPERAEAPLCRLLDGFGGCDAEGQAAQIRAARAELAGCAEEVRQRLAQRCRSFELLGFCTGAAILILVI